MSQINCDNIQFTRISEKIRKNDKTAIGISEFMFLIKKLNIVVIWYYMR